MFERFTEKARRVVFFARYEASQFGSPYIETEHLLLGLLREDKALINRFLHQHSSVESIRRQIEDRTVIREKVSTSVDLPLNNESKRVLAYAAEEAERLGNNHIGTEHLLLGILREDRSFAAQILQERGLRLEDVRQQVSQIPAGEITASVHAGAAGIEFVDTAGETLATAHLRVGIIPRVGEVVTLTNMNSEKSYVVESITHEYRQVSITVTSFHLLDKVVVVLKEQKNA